jgi:signal transduction histidine kinase
METKTKEQILEELGGVRAQVCELGAELNNVLAVILGNVSLIRSFDAPDDRDRRLGEAEKACERAAHIVKQLFSV